MEATNVTSFQDFATLKIYIDL